MPDIVMHYRIYIDYYIIQNDNFGNILINSYWLMNIRYDMNEEALIKIKQALDNSICPHGCKCYRIKPDEICKARVTDLENLLECLEDEPEHCTFSMAFGGIYYCKCQVRIELAKILNES